MPTPGVVTVEGDEEPGPRPASRALSWSWGKERGAYLGRWNQEHLLATLVTVGRMNGGGG